MKVTKAELMISAVGSKQYPPGQRPEIGLAGRSNVGKSSLINKLINRKRLAYTSQTPGKTQTLNFYLINDLFIFVDVPGYGYAKVPDKERQKWGEMIESYLTGRQQLQAVILIIDSRHPPTDDDVLMYNWLKYFSLPVIVVATKSDKVKKSRIRRHLQTITETLNIEADDPLICFSAETAAGKNELWQAVKSFI